VVVAHTKPGLAMMREALRPRSRAFDLRRRQRAYTRPARTLRPTTSPMSNSSGGPRRCAPIADVQFGPDPREWDIWTGTRRCSTAHSGTCRHGCSAPTTRTAPRSDHRVSGKRTPRSSPTKRHSQRPLTRNPTTSCAASRRRRRHSQACGRSLRPRNEELREQLARELRRQHDKQPQTLDLLLAATEIANTRSNTVGASKNSASDAPEDEFVCEIVEPRRRLRRPAAGYLATREGTGAGLWVARQRTWQIEFFQSPTGFTTRICSRPRSRPRCEQQRCSCRTEPLRRMEAGSCPSATSASATARQSGQTRGRMSRAHPRRERVTGFPQLRQYADMGARARQAPRRRQPSAGSHTHLGASDCGR